ncbi:MAG TPA: isoleucine--tRNA ligase [Candidatus Acidoferrales bacterium]|nr:isoleucine--tRNA ligase [Candidatus Acidoferrales bacterium]
MDYKDTLNLPKTRFPMRANLPQHEPLQVEKWESSRTYFKMVRANTAKGKYILHDGPPYANGNIHLGHALNKILKDIIVKYKNMTGYAAPYIPGWDCHGLPIELQVEKDIGRAKKLALSKTEIRRLCKEYAEKFIDIQRSEFKRLGVLGDWENPYRTIDRSYEAAEIRELGKLIARGALYRQKKPVYWCPSCVTALAEAEVEYEDHKAPSIYVKFPVQDARGKRAIDPGSYFVIWTTTPWTLPANQAIAVHPDFIYRRVKTRFGELIVNHELLGSVMEALGLKRAEFEVAPASVMGRELEGIICRHPWIERNVPIILGEFVTREQGTGCVHIAPGHGQEDYEVGQRYGLEVSAPLNPEGKFTAEAGDLEGEFAFDADAKIIEKLRRNGALLKEQTLTHSYPHCWRCKSPVLFRATEQWFISMERSDLRRQALAAVDRVQWIPPWGKDRIRGMLESRPDWCISRQRSWGVPIPVFYCRRCAEPVLSSEICDHVAEIFEREGSDAWFSRPAGELLPEGFLCPRCSGQDFVKEEDILDVWFDSGVSHAAVVEVRPELGGVSDLYLEGSDQHRGWFHTALLTSVATRGRAPYQSVLTHGFTLDGSGRKMSKSLGNVIAPQDIMKQYGAEILRLWVAAEDYREDVRLSDEILKRLVESYRKLRNTARFLISNLYDFDPARDAVPPSRLPELDRWILHRTQSVLKVCRSAYDRFEFHAVYHALNNFCSVDLSAIYLDIVKDRLYCEGARSEKRRAAQTALYKVLETLVHLMAPILSFTAEEVWEHMPRGAGRPESVFLSPMPEFDTTLADPELGARWERLLKIRAEILKALEAARNGGLIGHSLDAKVLLYPESYTQEGALADLLHAYARSWPEIAIVSQLELENGALAPELMAAREAMKSAAPGAVGPFNNGGGWFYLSPVLQGPIAVLRAEGAKCERCWNYRTSVGADPGHPTVCDRCAAVLKQGAAG